MVEAAYYGFYNWNGYGAPTKWINLQNYVRALSDPIFHNALFNNLLVILVSAFIQVPLALSVALLISDRTALERVLPGGFLSAIHPWRGRGWPHLALYV